MTIPSFLISGATGIVDEAPSPVSLTVLAGTTRVSSPAKYGGFAIHTGASGGDRVFAISGTKFAGIANATHTVEFWVYFDTAFSGVLSTGPVSWGGYDSGSDVNQSLVFVSDQSSTPGAGRTFRLESAGYGSSSSVQLANNAWHHVATVRTEFTFRLYANGVFIGDVDAGPLSLFATTDELGFVIASLGGVIDDFALSPGQKYTGATYTMPGELSFAEPENTGTATLTCPTPTVLILGSGAAPVGQMSATAPSPHLSAFGGSNMALTSPTPILLSTGRSSAGDNDFTYTAPSALLSAHGGANARLTAPSPALGVTATFVGWGKTGISAPGATLSASGTVSGTGQAALTLSTPYKLVGYSGAVASITLTGKYAVQAQSTAGSVGGAAITCPLFELSASGTAQNYGSADLLAPAARLGAQAQAWLAAPGSTLSAIGSATVTATYEAYAVNLLHRNTDTPVNEATRYTNFPFTHVVRYRNSYYGANATGLYLLEGTTDDGVPIPWEFKTTITDFESPMAKTVVSAYFAGRMGPAATVGIHLGESGDVSYSHSTPRGPVAQNYRQVFGLGLKARYYALSVAGEGIMELDSVEFNTKTLSRRI